MKQHFLIHLVEYLGVNSLFKMKYITVSVVFLVLTQTIVANYLTYEKCALKDSECLLKQARAVLPSFVQGIPELGIKKLDKLHMDKITIDIPGIYAELTNLEIGGLSKATIDDVSINVPYKLLRISFNTPNLHTEFDYKLNGTLFGFPVFGEGKGQLSLKNLQTELLIIFDIVKNDQGDDILEFKSFMYGADAIDGLHAKLENMYNGDKEKSDMYHEIVNKNWRIIATNYGRCFTSKFMEELVEVFKTCICQPLKDIAIWPEQELH
ncbi:circadian clock-controlled protein daywake-like [Bicyclus anynana]|uniref:Circadian clock-controlled protein daywake-like n=1 Tax=Bicyclus anynana TaxID=110368 RepID=A0ABM3LTS3_BICAN|nr:circadian clock-controlled protein daywake-like [Bicyclus anynana]